MLQRTRQSTWGHEQSWRSGKMETIPGQPGRTGVYIPVLWHWTESCIKWWCWKGQTWGVHYIFPSTKTFEAQAEPMGKKTTSQQVMERWWRKGKRPINLPPSPCKPPTVFPQIPGPWPWPITRARFLGGISGWWQAFFATAQPHTQPTSTTGGFQRSATVLRKWATEKEPLEHPVATMDLDYIIIYHPSHN